MELVNARIAPQANLGLLSHREAEMLGLSTNKDMHEIFRKCALAVLTSGQETDDTMELLQKYRDFDIRVVREDRGILLEINGAPKNAFVDGKMITGIRENLFAVLRDIVYIGQEIHNNPHFDLTTTDGITNAVFHILRNAGVMRSQTILDLVVCWGGHSIDNEEYDYTKEVGYHLGLRGYNIITGCGPGAMKGPMKGAAVAHAKQRFKNGRYIGITEPGIIAAEAPNPMVNHLVVLPDIEKRLEAFVRLGHGIIVFPGGVGTAEEILYMLGILLHPKNRYMPFPFIFTGPAKSKAYFQLIDEFIYQTLGDKARSRYKIIIDQPSQVALEIKSQIEKVKKFRRSRSDAYHFNWLLHMDPDLQREFSPTHEHMSALQINPSLEPHRLAGQLRKAFSGIVAGNVKDQGIREVEKNGPFPLTGDPEIMKRMDEMLRCFIDQGRMKLHGKKYTPCYKIVSESF